MSVNVVELSTVTAWVTSYSGWVTLEIVTDAPLGNPWLPVVVTSAEVPGNVLVPLTTEDTGMVEAEPNAPEGIPVFATDSSLLGSVRPEMQLLPDGQ